MTLETAPRALEGLRVLDLAGPMGVYCGRLLADLGADVIRVEPPGGSTTRWIGPFYQDEPALEHSLFDWHFNANKRGVTLDVAHPDGRALLLRMAASADVLIETMPPGRMEQFRLGYEALRGANSGLVYASITLCGQTGPFRDHLGEELVGQALGGLLWLCGWPDRPPVMMGAWPGMHQASAEAAAGILVALEHRDLTGEGQQVDTSIQASLPLSYMHNAAECHTTGRQLGRSGDYHPGPLNGLFRCKDGYADFRFRARPGRWERIVGWLDQHGMAEDLGEERWRSTPYRRLPENQAHIEQVFQRFIVNFTREEAMEIGQRTGIEVGAVYTARDVVCDPQLQARGYFVELNHPALGRSFTYPGAPYTLSETPWQLRRPAPRLGEHNHAVFADELGVSQEQLVSLRAAGVI